MGHKSPPDIVNSWNAEEYFTYAADLLKTSNPPTMDADMLAYLSGLGIQNGRSLAWKDLSLGRLARLKAAKAAGMLSIDAAAVKIATKTNGWQGLPNSIGDYETDYDTRAALAM